MAVKCVFNGYKEIEFEDQKLLLIEYPVNGFGSEKDLNKQHSLESLMNETLGWTGFGHFDGASIGGSSMEVCYIVVDFQIAQHMIADRLRNTEFSDYSRTCKTNEASKGL